MVGGGNVSPRAFRRRIVRYRHWHPLGCRAIELGNTAPWGCHVVICTPSYTVVITFFSRHLKKNFFSPLNLQRGGHHRPKYRDCFGININSKHSLYFGPEWCFEYSTWKYNECFGITMKTRRSLYFRPEWCFVYSTWK